jgi:hypothetical protein
LAMGVYMVPPIGAAVWIEFEQGDPNYPVWVGCQIPGTADVPTDALLATPLLSPIVLQTLKQTKIVVSDMPPTPLTGGIVMQTVLGASLVINDSGIYISNGKGASITLVGTQVLINRTSLVVLE